MTRPLRGTRYFVPLLLLGVLFFLSHFSPGSTTDGDRAPASNRVSLGSRATLAKAYLRWKETAARTGQADRLELSLRAPAGHRRAGAASGRVEFDLRTGALRLEAQGLPRHEAFDLWVLDVAPFPVELPGSPVAARVRLGTLRGEEAESGRSFSLAEALASGLRTDRLVVSRSGTDPWTAPLLVASPSLFQKLFYAEERDRMGLASARGAGGAAGALSGLVRPWLAVVPEPALAASAESPGLDSLIVLGESLFAFETFDGNGRTCTTCHPPLNNFTLDTTFISTLPPGDPLFVAEFDTNLTDLENPFLMRHFAMILENVDGLEDPTNKFVMRGVPHTLGLAFTTTASDTSVAPKDRMGWGGDGAPNEGRLRDFATGAVRQHLTKTLGRVPGTDFRFPTEDELDALEAYQLSLGRPEELDLFSLELTSVVADSGRKLFLQSDSEGGTKPAGKCNFCHVNGGGISQFFGANDNFNTGIENRVHPADLSGEPVPNDGGFGTTFNPSLNAFGNGEFNTPSVIETADTPPFFHNNIDLSLSNTVAFYSTPVFNNSPAGQLLKSMDSANQGIGVTATELTAFLRILNVLENLRSTVAVQIRALDCPDSANAAKLLVFADSEIEDARQVLTAGGLHPEAQPLLQSADSLNELAVAEADWGTRNSLLGQAISEENEARNLMVVGGVVAVPGPGRAVSGLELATGFPNPFSGSTVLTFTLPQGGRARLAVYDVAGRLVRILLDGNRDPGPQSVRWDGRTNAGREAPSGSYFVRLDALGDSRVQSVVRLR